MCMWGERVRLKPDPQREPQATNRTDRPSLREWGWSALIYKGDSPWTARSLPSKNA